MEDDLFAADDETPEAVASLQGEGAASGSAAGREERGMRHRKAGRKFGRNPAQRQALLRQLAISMILHERLTTTEAKAKSLRPVVEKLVTIARSDSKHHRNLVMSKIDHTPATAKLFEVIAPRFEAAPGGYTRISKLGVRHGDAAPMALIEFIEV